MLFQPFRLGELIDANGVLGTVKEIQFFSTELVTGNNKEISIPNAKIQNSNLVHYTPLGRLLIISPCSGGGWARSRSCWPC
jgi:small conductance mechanosensitive channel